MKNGGFLSRRRLIGSGLLSSAWAGIRTLGAKPGKCAGALPNVGPKPLAQCYTVAAKIPSMGFNYMHDPGMTMLPSGSALVAAPCLERPTRKSHDVSSWKVFISRSTDGGATWEDLPTLPLSDATPFVHAGKLYMFVQPEKWRDVSLIASDDEGETWSTPVRLYQGSYWNCDTGMVQWNGYLYWALSTRNYQGGVVVVVGDLSKNLLDPRAWRMSTEVDHPKTPITLSRHMYPRMLAQWKQWPEDSWLEPNVVLVNGGIRVLLRTVLDGYGTAGMCAVCDLEDDSAKMSLRFTQFYPIPGGQNKFYILYDQSSRLFWMASNLAVDPQEQVFNWKTIREGGRFAGGPGNDRRFLMLSYSVDALNWFPAGCIAMSSNPHQSFMYPAADFDGNDIVLISRTSRNGRDQHDADLVTFHRVRNFRSLALNLCPQI